MGMHSHSERWKNKIMMMIGMICLLLNGRDHHQQTLNGVPLLLFLFLDELLVIVL